MFKCDECLTLFEEPVQIPEEHGEIFNVCPNCMSTDHYKVFKCKLCNEWIYPWNIEKDLCYDCARKSYTNRLGLRFIEKNKDFYLDFYGVEKVDKDSKTDLIEILEKDFLNSTDMDTDWNGYLARVKEYIFDGYMSEWIEFLIKEGEV